MKIEVNLEKNYFFTLLAVLIVLSGALVVYAYNSSPANPATMGHSANELDVNINGNTYTLQQAITQGLLGNSSGGGVSGARALASIISSATGYADWYEERNVNNLVSYSSCVTSTGAATCATKTGSGGSGQAQFNCTNNNVMLTIINGTSSYDPSFTAIRINYRSYCIPIDANGNCLSGGCNTGGSSSGSNIVLYSEAASALFTPSSTGDYLVEGSGDIYCTGEGGASMAMTQNGAKISADYGISHRDAGSGGNTFGNWPFYLVKKVSLTQGTAYSFSTTYYACNAPSPMVWTITKL